MALGGAVAPLIGGAFAQSPQSGWMGWRWCFWICLPLTAIATALIAFFFHPHNPRTSLVDGLLSIDWLGTILISGAAIMLQLGLQFGGEAFSWTSPTVLCLLIFSAVTFGLFVVVEAKIPSKPITPARLVDDRSSAALLFIAIIHGFCYISIIFYLPLYFQMVLGATAVQAGVWLLIGTLTMPVCTIASGLFMKQAGRFVPPIRTACLFMTIGFGLFISFPAHLSWARIAVFQVVLAFGLGPLFQAPVLALQAHVSQEDAGAANSLLLFVRTISAAVGLIAGQTVLHNQLRTFARNAGMSSEAVKAMFSNSGAQSLAAMNLNPAQEALVSQAIAKALSSMWILYTVVAFLALVASWFVEERELTIRAVSDPEAPMLVRAATLNGRDSKGEC
jgi:MFS family permease